MAKDGFLARITEWAERQPDIRTIVLTGSRARDDGSVDETSDYDVEVFTTDRAKYETHAGWMEEIGDVWVYLPETRADDRYLMRLVVFEGGMKLDFALAPTTVLEEMVTEQKLNSLYERGYRVLLDKDGLAARLPRATHRPPIGRSPTEEEFRAVVEEFWFEASHVPKLLQRNELWVVKTRDWTMKLLLLKMIEWHAIATRGESYDVWHIGSRMEKWAAPQVWERLHAAFGRFNAGDVWPTLLATASLFRDLAIETSEKLGHRYPHDVDRSISGYMRKFEGRF